MSRSHWDERSDSDRVTGLDRDSWLVGHRKILAWQLARLPRYRREGAVEVRPFPAKMRLRASMAQGLSGEAVKGNPPTTVIPRVDESKSSPRTTEDLTEPRLTREGFQHLAEAHSLPSCLFQQNLLDSTRILHSLLRPVYHAFRQAQVSGKFS